MDPQDHFRLRSKINKIMLLPESVGLKKVNTVKEVIEVKTITFSC